MEVTTENIPKQAFNRPAGQEKKQYECEGRDSGAKKEKKSQALAPRKPK